MSSSVRARLGPITPSHRLAFTVKRCQLPRRPRYLRSPAVCPCLYINRSPSKIVPTATTSTTHPEGCHSTQYTHSHYTRRNTTSHSNAIKMAPHFGQGARRTAPHAARGESPLDIPLVRPQGSCASTSRKDSRARETQRKRDRRERRSEVKIGCSPITMAPLRRPVRQTDRATEDRGDGEHGSKTVNGTNRSLPCAQQDHRVQEYAISEDGVVQPPSLPSRCQVQVNTTTSNNTGKDVDDFADLFGPDPLTLRPPRQPASTKPIQYGTSHDLPFNLHLHAPRPVQPATREEPIRMFNSWAQRQPDEDGPLPGSGTQPPSSTPKNKLGANKRPVNTYKGSDVVKRRVQNNLLRCILSDRPLPKPRKNADRMVLKCTGKQEFR